VLEGVDVSEHQGSIDWRAVAASGRSFAFIRAADGQYRDQRFATNWAGARAAGLTRSAYQFFRPTIDPIAQAGTLLSMMGPLAQGDLPPVLDVETFCPPPGTTCTSGGASPDVAADGIARWVDYVSRATQMMPILYASPSFWSQIPPRGTERRTLPWIANWNVSAPAVPKGWKHWAFWQYTDRGSVPGISVPVDLDRFEGTFLDLKLLTRGGLVRVAAAGTAGAVLVASVSLAVALFLGRKPARKS